MPTVRTYGPPKVSSAPIPGVRQTAAETPLSMGAGVEQAKASKDLAAAGLGGQAASIGVGIYAEQQQAERDKADETASLNAETQLGQWVNHRVNDPDTGALTVKGKDAMGLPGQVLPEFDQTASDIASGLTNDRQRMAFARVKANARLNLDGTLERHVFSERQKYDLGELNSFVETKTSTAITNANDLRVVGQALQDITDKLHVQGPRLGMGPEQLAAATRKAQTDFHVGIVERFLTEGQDKKAQAYFDETKTQIDGAEATKLEKALEVGSTLGDAQRQSDAIVQAGGTFKEQMEKVRAIDNPKLRQAVQDQVEHRHDADASAARADMEAKSTDAFNIVDRTHDIRGISPVVWATFNGATKESLRSYAEKLTKGEPIETDAATYYALMTQAGTDPAAFVKQNLLNYKGKLAPAAWKEAVDLQRSLQASDLKKADQQRDGFRTKDQILRNSLAQYGIPIEDSKQTDEQKTAIGNLWQLVDRHVTALETGGKKASNDEIQTIVYDLLNQQRTTPGSFWGGLLPFSGGHFADQTTKLIDIPTLDRQQIEDAMRRKWPGRPITDADVLAVYVQTHK